MSASKKSVEEKIDELLTEIKRWHIKLEKLSDEDRVNRIYLLSQQLVFIGQLSTIFYEQKKRLSMQRKSLYNQEYLKAKGNKSIMANMAIEDIKKEETEAEINHYRWNNAFTVTREEINALKYKVRIDLADGSSSNNL
ncbi:hypothetical protein [Amphibacillus xylanus]|uniref:Uncharacterized protein n=1 Tax=Amphibacillus xylanus (strain ATCC 51415 / DSM 6626 / JCM 7361 / LMG 17667 / NBRC 15112 / Ep01) TaxID=698758 RepID=K0J1G0_AMPXN|nr:hypothetical protein [Amphibacillus xylanus]BAM46331.1 hypothetical protein AXY_01990 [Amphibacillus xylanus NBRC 15112]